MTMTHIYPSRHGRPSTYTAGCRCAACREANRTRCAEWRERVRPQTTADWAALAHGKVSTYVNYGCRCDDCKKAHSEALAQQHERAKRVTDYTHGTWSAYHYRGCRCEACRYAARVFRSKKRKKGEVEASVIAEKELVIAEVPEASVEELTDLVDWPEAG